MTRKSQQPGGHNPLTYHERKRLKSSGYGTQSARLATSSQLPFGHCSLGLSPIEPGDAVATPSGHIYSREAIVQYLLTKNGELKKRRAEYERRRLEVENRRVEWEEKEGKRRRDTFVRKDQGAMSSSSTTALVLRGNDSAGGAAVTTAGGSAAAVGKGRAENSLKHVSYWLATSQPQHQNGGAATDVGDFDYEREIAALPPPPPERPSSPNSGEPLRLKQLIPLHLVREGAEDGDAAGGKGGGATGRILCAVSHKTLSTQPVVVIKKTGQVMLKSAYEELAKPTMTCPVTDKRFKEKDVLELVRGRSGYAASGEVVARKYNPTLTERGCREAFRRRAYGRRSGLAAGEMHANFSGWHGAGVPVSFANEIPL
eukprot:CAMPEP_0172532370 /NCGR_PEP_ID=MMETSP1067-20121228/5451_1 /TAXON_ID=265564 ORGANISM="Thalassiosira punctigera, Strain Tpunct2005C2" /NCGR_SAMPLE_ID=MMETSP1067 /ASSEMBLY_ACC=CAM_ASM_000444 /LENGTH=370 /DNA_ID=CAMNT_0013316877 /DNA_START=75 /DNA_END=1188 /DNA_ORIENTATION=+